ncbi:MAG: methyltransferase domain-containing protein [Ginsengibacter sp.]
MKHPDTLYNIIGTDYNATRQSDPYIAGRLLQHLNPQITGTYLDIGCGTGNYTISLAGEGINFWGIDPSEKMIREAKTKSGKPVWLIGSAEQIPANNQHFNGAIAVLTIHHWTHVEKSFNELSRVLKNDGRLIIFTATPEQMKGYWLNHYFPGMLRRSIDQMSSFESIQSAAQKAGFTTTATEKYFIQKDLKDLFLYSGKQRPEIYFNHLTRKGISSFAALSTKDEMHRGLLQLQSDIDTKEFEGVKSTFNTDSGDYLFIIMEKRLYL